MEKIIRYFLDEKNTTEIVSKILAKTITKYPDIKNEFIYWIENRNFESPNAIEVNGYSAAKIHEINPSLDGAGVYNFLVTLRDNPDKAFQYIQSNFPTK